MGIYNDNIEKEIWKNKLIISGMKEDQIEMCSKIWDIWENIKTIEKLLKVKENVENLMIKIDNDIKEGRHGSLIIKDIEKIFNDIEVLYREDVKLKYSYYSMYDIVKKIYEEINERINDLINSINFDNVCNVIQKLDAQKNSQELEDKYFDLKIKKEDLIDRYFIISFKDIELFDISCEDFLKIKIEEAHRSINKDGVYIWNIVGNIFEKSKWNYIKTTMLVNEDDIDIENGKLYPYSISIYINK